MAQTIKGFKINGDPHFLDAMFLSGQTKEELLAGMTGGTSSNPVLDAIYVNAKNNLEIKSGVIGAAKVNLVAADAIQLKTGDGQPLQLDCEQNTVDLNEYGVKVCNGSMDGDKRVVALKLNTAELILDTQKANTNEFDREELQVKFRYDKKDHPIYAKMKARAFDFRCYDHGGIALQIAGADSSGKENKIKFESDRTTVPGATGEYNGEGGKGLEFGTFNNEHTSLYTGDYRFKGDANVFGVTRNTPVLDNKGKTDYPTQGDDFKDVIDASTPKATWNEIIDAANKCKNLEETINNKVAEAAMDASGIDVSGFVTRDTVEEVVASAITDMHIDTSAVESNLKQWVLDKHYVDALPDTLQYIKMGKSKGNFAVDVTGKYTWELTSPKETTSPDEYNVNHAKGDRVVNYTNEAFYTDPNKVYYKAGIDTVLADEETAAPEGTIVYNSACVISFGEAATYQHFVMGEGEASFYEDETKFVFKGTKNISIKFNETTPIKKKEVLDPSRLSEEELEYYENDAAVYDEEGKLVSGWEKTPIWAKSTLWTKNEINVNLETDSKIKFSGKKIETVWAHEVNGVDVETKMDDILLSTNTLSTDANEVVFEQKISKNGDRSGQDTEFVYTFGNNVADTEKVADFATFKANYNGKHTPKTDEELQAMYDAFLAEGQSFEIRVKVSELLGLVARVADLEARLAALEASGVQGPQGPQGPAGADGVNGENGAQGPQGPAGADGADGQDGAQGPQGPAGADGANGEDGAQGPQGPAGADGQDGAQGPQGPEGPEYSPESNEGE